jgi:dipeptidase E
MKLIFYSGGHDFENILIDKNLLELSKKESPQITYIPSCSYLCEQDFKEFVTQYGRFNIHNIINFPIDVPYTDILKAEVLKSDIIHLSGGNTYYFLKYLRKSGMLKELKTFVKNGGILTGLSAGAIIMTKSIETAGFPSFDKDDNDENLTNLKGMGLVNFNFFPHYKNSKRYDREIVKYSRSLDSPVYACPDGSGIIVDDNELTFIGKAFCFFQGKKIIIK